MKIFVISDNVDTSTGLRLVGVDGTVAHTREEVKKALEKVISDKDIGILLITENSCRKYADLIDDIKLNMTQPLIVEIPDRHGSGRSQNFISAYIREAIGVKLSS